MTDVIAALRAFLLADEDTADLVGTRVFAGELPRAEVEQMPRTAVVLVYAGGIERNRYLPIAEPRLDVWSYGATYHEAAQVDRAVYQALKDLKRETVGDTVVHGIALSGGPLSLRDGDTGWPMMVRSITVAADERPTEE